MSLLDQHLTEAYMQAQVRPGPEFDGRGIVDFTIIEGEARGADTLAKQWAEERYLPVEKYPANWDTHGKAAGPIRNKQMLTEGKPDLVIAFLAPNSRGTANMISQAEKAGVPVKVIHVHS